MHEKKFSMIILAFIFLVAIPSTVFLFSDLMSTGEFAYSVPKQQTNFANDPTPDRTGRGVTVQERIGEIYKTPEVPDRAPIEDIYSYRKAGCPLDCAHIGDLIFARDLEQMGRNIIYFKTNDNLNLACECPKNFVFRGPLE